MLLNETLTFKKLTEMAYGLGDFEPITTQQLLELIMQFDADKLGMRPISFTSVTNPVYRKTGFPYAKLYKVGQTAGMLGFDYEANVNAQREREGKEADFVKQNTSKVKEWLSPSIGITNTGLTVIQYRPLNPQPSYWVVEERNGQLKQITNEEAATFMSPSTGVSSQGVDNVVAYRLYGIDKIVAVSFLKKEYVVVDADPERVKVFQLVQQQLKS